MNVPSIRNRMKSVSGLVIAGVATVVLTIAYAAPSFGSADSARSTQATAAQEVQDVAYRGRAYRRGYRRGARGAYYRGGYRGYYGARGYGYYGRPYRGGGAVVTPWARVYW